MWCHLGFPEHLLPPWVHSNRKQARTATQGLSKALQVEPYLHLRPGPRMPNPGRTETGGLLHQFLLRPQEPARPAGQDPTAAPLWSSGQAYPLSAPVRLASGEARQKCDPVNNFVAHTLFWWQRERVWRGGDTCGLLSLLLEFSSCLLGLAPPIRVVGGGGGVQLTSELGKPFAHAEPVTAGSLSLIIN